MDLIARWWLFSGLEIISTLPFLPSPLLHPLSLHWDKVRDEEEKREEREEKEEMEGEGRNGGGEEGGRFGLNPSFPKDEEKVHA